MTYKSLKINMINTTLEYLSLNTFTRLQRNVTSVPLEYFQCFVTDFPESGIDCSLNNSSICVTCKIRGAYLTGESINDQALSYLVFKIVLIISIVVGIVGVLANILTIIVLHIKRVKCKTRAFDLLLLYLAYADLFCCLASLPVCAAQLIYLDTWQKSSKLLSYWLYISMLVLQLCRSTSFYLTVLITLERYLVIVYPIRSRTWFSRTKSKLQALFILIYVFLLFMPRYTSVYVGENIFSDENDGLNIPSLKDFKYIFLPTKWHIVWLNTLGESYDFFLQLVKFWVPNFCLLIFNTWTVKKIKHIKKQRLYLSSNQRKELQVAKMFVPVVAILLACSFWTVVTFTTTYVTNIFYRELWIGLVLVYNINSASNFFIYFFRGEEFRSATNSLLFSSQSRVQIQ